MVNTNSQSTVLYEHRKIVTARHILAIVNFLAIFAGTVATIVFSARRGTPAPVALCLYLLMAVNLVQIGLCIADYVLKQFFGIYVRAISYVAYAVGLLWLGGLVAEFVVGTSTFGTMRTDLLCVAVIQLVIAVVAYVIWPALDRRAIDTMIRSKVRDDEGKRAKSAKRFVVGYAVLCAVIILMQAAALFVYKLPPTLYDLFSDTRALEYTLTEDGNSYVVTGVYAGTSPRVNIPANYNNKPVVGIATGALVDDDVVERFKVSEITFGTKQKVQTSESLSAVKSLAAQSLAEEETYETVSNLVYIESGAISNDKIETLVIPASVARIDRGAIRSSSLKRLQYEARANFAYNMLENCASLERIYMQGEGVGNITSLDGMANTVQIQVSKDNYNAYRQQNPEYLANFSPALSAEEFCVDFYTGCDYYIDSIFCEVGKSVDLTADDLINKNSASKGLDVDTRAYLENKREFNTDGAKADSAFRGWYYNAAFTQECSFERGVSLTESTSLYAKWLNEYTGTLDWGTFEPDGVQTYLYWTDEDEIALPVYGGRLGYTDGIAWKVEGTNEVVKTTRGISASVALKGEWQLDKPTVSIQPVVSGNADNFIIASDMSEVNFPYDEDNSLRLSRNVSHVISDSFDFEWRRNGVLISNLTYIDLQNVSQSGVYTLSVTARAALGETATTVKEVSVNIAKKSLGLDKTFKLSDVATTYDGSIQTNGYSYSGSGSGATYLAANDIAVSYVYRDANGAELAGGGARDAGEYSVTAHFEKNNAIDAANYDVYDLTAAFTIKPVELGTNSFAWKIDGTSKSSVEYSASLHTVSLELDGVVSGDAVSLILNGYTGTNANTYTATVTGVNNKNYSVTAFRQTNNASFQWEITKKKITGVTWLFDGVTVTSVNQVYDAAQHKIEVRYNGLLGADQITPSYDLTEGFCIAAKDAGHYQTRLNAFEHENYIFDGANFEWDITKKTLSLTGWTVKSAQSGTQTSNAIAQNGSVEYNSYGYTLAASISGVCGTDSVAFTYDGNTGVAVGGYTTKVSLGAQYSNYTFADQSIEWSIAKKQLAVTVPTTAYTYNGTQQSLTVRVSGLAGADLTGASVSYFTYASGSVSANGVTPSGSDLVLAFPATNAGSYKIEFSLNANMKNYAMTACSTTIPVAKKLLTVSGWQAKEIGGTATTALASATTSEITYNGVGYTVSATLSGVVAGDTVALSYSTSKGSQTAVPNAEGNAVGIYATTASLPSTYSNYSFTSTTVNWSIVKKNVTIAWQNTGSGAFTYNAQYQGPSFVLSGLCGSDTVTVDASLTGGDKSSLSFSGIANGTVTFAGDNGFAKNAGNYTIALALGSGATNYQISTASYKTASFTINKAPVAVSWTGSSTYTYNKTRQGKAFSLSGIMGSDSLSANINCNSTVVNAVTSVKNGESYISYANTSVADFALNAATYDVTISLSGSAADNYLLSGNTTTWTISPKTVYLDGNWIWSNGQNATTSGKYDSNTVLVYNGQLYNVTSNLRAGDVYDGDTYTLNGTGTTAINAGTYTVSITGISNANYTLSSTNASVTFTISPKPVNFIWSVESSYVFSGASQSVSVSYATVAKTSAAADDGKVISGDAVTISASHLTEVNAATYAATVTALTGAQGGNYTIGANSSRNWTIAPYTVTTVRWSADSFTYNGNIQRPTASITYGGTVYSFVTSQPSSRTVATYSIAVTGTLSQNFLLADSAKVSHSYTIDAKPITLEWDTTSYTYNGQAHSLTARATNLCGSDTVTFTYSNNSRTAAGTQTVTVNALSNNNYIIDGNSNASQTLTVTQKTISVVWGTASYNYDGSLKTLSAAFAANAIVSGDSVTLSLANNTRTDAGSQVATASIIGTDAANYLLSGTTQTLTVNRATATVVWSGSESVVFDGLAHSLTATASGTAFNNSYLSVSGTAGTAVGTYTFTVSLSTAASTNYVLSGTLSKTLTITKKPVTIVWSGSSFTYDGTAKTVTATANGLVGGYTSVTVTVSGNSNTNAGSYTATATGLSGTNAGNYTIASTATTAYSYTIEKATAIVSWSGEQNVTYDGLGHRLTATVTGVNGALPTTYYTVTTSSYTNAGTYTYSVGLTVSGSNYNIVSNRTATLTINAKKVALDWAEEADHGDFAFVINDASVAFSVTVTKPDGTTETFNSDSVDGYTECGVSMSDLGWGSGTYTFRFNGLNDTINYELTGTPALTHTVTYTAP